MQKFSFLIQSLTICSPAVGCVNDSMQKLQWNENADIAGWVPDMSFIPKRKFRRLSRLSKMALYAAHHAAQNADQTHKLGASIFCSRFGELKHAVSIIDDIHDKEPISPLDFSHSVHNTAQGLFSILQGSHMPATVITARHDLLENALMKAHAQLMGGDEAVMIVYHEDRLPEVYENLLTANIMPLAFAFVVSNVGENLPMLELLSKVDKNDISPNYDNIHAQNVVRMLWSGKGKTALKTNRIEWNWRLK